LNKDSLPGIEKFFLDVPTPIDHVMVTGPGTEGYFAQLKMTP
jgi:hypothetical protein